MNQTEITVRVETLGELDAAMKAARDNESGAYIEIIGGRMDMPQGLALAHTRLKEMYGRSPGAWGLEEYRERKTVA